MDNRTLFLAIGGGLLVVLLIAYIIALVKSKRRELIFTYNGWDMALLLACPILLTIGWCANENPSWETFRNIVWILAGLCLLGTIILSVLYNRGTTWKILCSIGAKLFVVILTCFIILLLIAIFVIYVILTIMSEHNERDEYIILKYDRFLKSYVGYKYTI